MNTEIIANGNLIDDAKQAANDLLASVGDSQLCREGRAIIEKIPAELQQRYDAIRVMVADRCADLDSALVACISVQDALDNITSWLNGTDNSLAQVMEPASLIRDRVDGKLRLLKVLRDDVLSYEPAIQKMRKSAQQFIKISSYATETGTVQHRNMVFNEISTTLEVFTKQVESFDIWYSDTIDFLELVELLQMDADESAQRIDDQMKPHFDEIIRNGESLTNKEDTTDQGPCTRIVRDLEVNWKKLVVILGERRTSNRAGKQSLNASEAFRGQMNVWLAKMKQRVEELEPLAVDADMLKPELKTQAKFPKCDRCGNKSGEHATKDCKVPRCLYCSRWRHTAEDCFVNPDSAKYKADWAAAVRHCPCCPHFTPTQRETIK